LLRSSVGSANFLPLSINFAPALPMEVVSVKISDIQKEAKDLVGSQNWYDRSVDQRFRYLVSEVGELSRELLRLNWKNQDSVEVKENIGAEMYDIIWNLCDLANLLEIDLEEACQKKQAYNKTRGWSQEDKIDEPKQVDPGDFPQPGRRV
jgi:NTP pyrophosphatase (non-canonical NTP hydrolase)